MKPVLSGAFWLASKTAKKIIDIRINIKLTTEEAKIMLEEARYKLAIYDLEQQHQAKIKIADFNLRLNETTQVYLQTVERFAPELLADLNLSSPGKGSLQPV